MHRINEDGTIPKDNPFVGKAPALPSIYTYGNRNPQGLTLNPSTGVVWEVEHGPRGGDELNIIRPGRNYGWPVITYGMNYNGTPWGDAITAKEGMEQPLTYWTPSLAVSSLAFYRGDKFPQWKGQILLALARVPGAAPARADRREGDAPGSAVQGRRPPPRHDRRAGRLRLHRLQPARSHRAPRPRAGGRLG